MSPVNTRLKLCSSLVLITFYYLQPVFKLTINQFENLSKLMHDLKGSFSILLGYFLIIFPCNYEA